MQCGQREEASDGYPLVCPKCGGEMASICALCDQPKQGGTWTNGDGYGDAKHVGIVPPSWALYCWDCCKARPGDVPNLSAEIDAAFAEHGFCGFLEAWIGRCREPRGTCAKHDGQRCWKCHAPAVSNCSVAGALVCGIPECADHPHTDRHAAREAARLAYLPSTTDTEVEG
jgi:hypothetical protein